VLYQAARRARPEFKEVKAGYNASRYATPLGNLAARLRSRTVSAFKARGFKKGSKTEVMLGCNWGFLKIHIELQFTDGMSWENRHLWHLDHEIPLSSAKDEAALIKLCHYTNLQPLWAKDNLSKKDKMPIAP
jgi:hypothetical protein